MLGEEYGSGILEQQGRLPPRRGMKSMEADGGGGGNQAWGEENTRTPAAIMLEKVNLHLEVLRMPTANHDVEVHLARQALRALSEAVTKDAGETIAAMKLHRRSQNEIKMLRERNMLLERDMKIKQRNIDKSATVIEGLREKMKENESAAKREERLAKENGVLRDQIRELRDTISAQVADTDTRFRELLSRMEAMREREREIKTHMYAVQAVVDARESIARLMSTGSAEVDGVEITVYTVKVLSGGRKGAGTTANVTIAMTGTKDRTEELELQNSIDNFTRGKEDEFTLHLADIGDVNRITIAQDKTGAAPGWFCEKVTVINESTNKEYEFECGRWLDDSQDDGKTKRELMTGSNESDMAHYTVMALTGDKRGCCTDANVHMTLYGANGDGGLRKLESGQNDFERAQDDKFEFECEDLGVLTKIRIGHDNDGVGPGWFCDRLLVTKKGSTPVTFPVYQWFDKSNGDGLIERTVKPGEGGPAEEAIYTITTRTGDVRGAGTDANIKIIIKGTNGDSSEVALESGANNFERGAVEDFILTLTDHGKLTSVRVLNDGSGLGSAWFLESLSVRDHSTMVSTDFMCSRWLNDKEGLFVDLKPGGVPPAKPVAYTVTVHTGAGRGSGTDANVFIEMFGPGGEASPKLELESGANDFERGAVDVFTVNSNPIGDIQRIRIGHDNSGPGPGWFAEKIVVEGKEGVSGRWEFPCGRWFSDSEDDRSIVRDLVVDGVDPRDALVKYEVNVTTADKRGCGTDANVTLIIFGSQGDTGEKALESGKDDFERGQTDNFVCEAIDVGNIERIQLGHDNSGLGPAWLCDSVSILNPKTQQKWSFNLQNWFDKQHGLTKVFEAGAEPEQMTKYRVVVHTANSRGAGTDANVYINLMGESGESSDKVLESGQDDFERGQADEFVLEVPDIGMLKSIKIGHDNSGPGAGWKLDNVLVQNMLTKEQIDFKAFRWLDKNQDDGATSLTISAQPLVGADGKPVRFLVPWHIKVKTTDERGSGTDAAVFIKLIGESGVTDNIVLESGADDFERGATNEFKIQTKDIGKLVKIRIGHDGQGLGAGWHMDTTEVEDEDNRENYVFECHRWFDEDQDGGLIVRELLPGSSAGGGGGEAGPDGKVTYEIEVHTGTIRGAGTDANVDIEIIGDEDFTGKMKLENSKNNFEKGKVDKFKMNLVDVGPLQKIRIGHDNKGMTGAWFLDKVVIKKSNSDDMWEFGCNRWLAKDEDDGAIIRELVPMSAPPLLKYQIKVVTGDFRGAGTDANVTMVLYGPNDSVTGRPRDSGERKLETGKDNFERKKEDLFLVECQDLGGIEKIRIGHDGDGLGAGWFLGQVEVWEEDKEAAKVVFKCERWLDAAEDDGAIVRVLTLDSIAQVKYTSYLVSVYTGSMRGSGTDANVKINIFGDSAESGERKLESGKNDFERGRKDDFTIKLPTLTSDGDDGNLKKIRIGHDGKGVGAGWYLDKVIIQDMTVSTDQKQRRQWYFPAYRWLDEGEGDNQLHVVINATDASDVEPGKPNTYTITTVTGNRRGAGTDANVFIDVVGESGESGRQQLESSRANFERGKTDEFRISTPSLGAITKIRIGHDAQGMGAGWFLEKVFVKDDATGLSAAFPIYRWLDKKPSDDNPEGRTLVEMVPAKGDADDENVADFFKIEVVTGDRRGAGTDANVFIELVGSKGASGTKKLDARASDFERGNTDEFRVECSTALGELTKMRIGHDNSGWSAGWFLERVMVLNERTGQQYSFIANKWFDKKEGDKQVIRELLPGEADEISQVIYKVRVKTADQRGAGTSARVFINIIGDAGETGDRPLDASRSNFSRASDDEFLIQAVSCGQLSKVRIGHDNKGLAPGWFLTSVEIVEAGESGEEDSSKVPSVFQCGRWFARSEDDGQIVRELVAAGSETAEGAPTNTGNYTVSVHTGDVKYAGTDANVYVTIYGEKGDTGSRQLSNKWKNDFERNQIDKFTIEAADLGKITKVRIGHDGTGRGSGWFVDHVDVQRDGAEKETSFPCQRWLDENEDDGLTERELWPSDSGKATARVTAAQEGLITYNVMIHTGDVYGAGTDANIKVVLTGKKGSSGERIINNGRGKFERDTKDNVSIEAADLGEITKILIGHDNKGFMAGWYLDTVVVTNSVTGESYDFPCSRHFDRDEDDGQTERELMCGRGAPEVYTIAVTSGDVKGAGTNADVYVELIGETGTSGRRKLDKAARQKGQKGSLFESGQVNVFELEVPALGDIKHTVIGHNGSGLGAGWNLKEITVTSSSGSSFKFENADNEGWLDAKEGDGEIERRLTEVGHTSSGSLHIGKETTYSVSVVTGKVSGAGTNAKVFLTLFGETDNTGERELPSKRSHFESGCVDVFQLSAVELGELMKLRVRHDGAGMGAGWFLERVDVKSELTGAGVSFSCSRWLDKNEDDGEISRELFAEPMA